MATPSACAAIASCRRSRRRAISTTVAPRSKAAVATARPIPADAPTTTTLRPARSAGVSGIGVPAVATTRRSAADQVGFHLDRVRRLAVEGALLRRVRTHPLASLELHHHEAVGGA